MDEGRHSGTSRFSRSRAAVILTITVSRKDRMKSKTTVQEECFIAVHCIVVPPLPTQASKSGGMLSKRLESRPDAFSESGSQASIQCIWQEDCTAKNNEGDIKKSGKFTFMPHSSGLTLLIATSFDCASSIPYL